MSAKEQAKKNLQEAVEMFWLSIEEYQKGGHYFVWNNGLNLLKTHVKRFGANIKADLGKAKFQRDQTTPAPPIVEARGIEETEIEDKVTLADNGETPKAKKEATKKRRTRKKKSD